MKSLTFRTSVCVNKGCKRENNQDNFYVNGIILEEEMRNEPVIFVENRTGSLYFSAVFDGMGGEELGEVASFIASSTLRKYQTSNYADFIEKYIAEINEAILNETVRRDKKRIGTTIALLNITGKIANCCNVGDSRIYLLRGKKLKQISFDHASGNKLTQHIGMSSDDGVLVPYKQLIKIKRNDVFLLCSDGLTDLLSNSEIESILNNNTDDKTSVITLVNNALNCGGHDNITVMSVKIL